MVVEVMVEYARTVDTGEERIKMGTFNAVRYKRRQYKYLYRKMLDKNIILQAYKNLRKGKTKRIEIQYIDRHLDEEINKLQQMIYYTRKEFENTEYYAFGFFSNTLKPKFILEHGKQRKIFMPEMHEQWIHHIIILILHKIIYNRSYVYSCGSMPGRGAHYAKKYLERKIKENPNQYCLKMDIRHFYNNINKKRLLDCLRYIIADEMFMYVIERCLMNFKKGLPLGFYISQWFANYYLEDADRYIIILKCIAYIRYMDDMVIYADSKEHLHKIKKKIAKYLCKYRFLKLKGNYQVFQVTDIRPIDFMGFKFYLNKTTIRKNIMLGAIRLAKKIAYYKFRSENKLLSLIKGLLSYYGWFKYSNTQVCYKNNITSIVDINKLREIISEKDKIQKEVVA